LDVKEIKTALLVINGEEDASAVSDMFNHQGHRSFEVILATSIDIAKKRLVDSSIDAILLDLALPKMREPDAVAQIRALAPHVAIVLLLDPADEATAIEAMKDGAQDYLIKGQVEPRELLRALRNACERKILEESLFEEKERAQVTLHCMGDGVICSDDDGNVTFLNAVSEKLTGWTLSEARGHAMSAVFHIINGLTREVIANPMDAAIAKNRTGHLPLNTILIRRDGHEAFIEDSAAPIHNRAGKTTGSVIVFRDVSEAQAMKDKLLHSTQHDSLTGLPNRSLLTDRLNQSVAFAQRHQAQFAVMFLDLDGFKHINDSLGHQTGDKLLQSIAKRLQKCVRAVDTVSRQGGDEFIVLLQELGDSEDALIGARRVLGAVTGTHHIDGHSLQITASLGVSVYPSDGEDSETLIKNADTAMYQAKRQGHHHYAFFKPTMNDVAVERQYIEEELRRGLEQDEFKLHYQPKYSLKTGEIVGAEALIRWIHPTRGAVPPGKFIPIAEDCGLIVQIGAWVLRQACGQARAWVDEGLPATPVAVNVSAIRFGHEDFANHLFGILDETGLDGGSLELEMTEGVLMQRTEQTATFLNAVRNRGVQVSIDDFGTGYSSLSYLTKFPLDALKIDQSFVHKITDTPNKAAIVSAIISMGRSLGLRVIAEGVETADDLEFLMAHDCDEAQGFYFSPAIRPEEFAKMLRANAS
jgi:diguanylate cyclase (GGDEF)-like protein/PAS domain S-box-containing protein